MGEMLKSKGSLYGFLGAVIGGAALSVVSGGLAIVPMLGFVAAEGVASLFIPSSSWWRTKVDKKYRAKHRQKLRDYLERQLGLRGEIMRTPQWGTYQRMRARVKSLEETAHEKMTTITDQDVERLDDATVNYLSMWLMWVNMKERQRTFSAENVAGKLKKIAVQLQNEKLGGSDRKRLEKAQADLEAINQRRASIESHVASTESGMIAVSDSLEEVYQNIMRNPAGTDVRSFLDEAIEHMAIEENIEADAEEELRKAFEELESELE